MVAASVAGSGGSLSFGMTDTSGGVTVEGREERLPVAATTERGSYSYVADNHFDVLGMPLLQGRAFGPADRAGGEPAAIVNEEAASRWWPQAGGNVVGKRFKLGPPASPEPWVTVIGVVPTVRTNSVQALEWEPAARAYFPLAAGPGASIYYFYVRTAADPLTLVPVLRTALAGIGSGMLVRSPSDEGAYLPQEIAYYHVNADILTGFASFAVVLAAMGIYAVVAYGVARRTREIGVRIALGARNADVLGTVSRESAVLAAAGIVVGLGLSTVFTRSLESMLYGIDPLDPWVFATAAVGFGAVVALATYIPARRATRVDPMLALRSE